MSLKVSDPHVLLVSILIDLLVCCDVEHNLQVSVPTIGVKVFQVVGKDGNGRNHFIVCADDEVNNGDGSRGQ